MVFVAEPAARRDDPVEDGGDVAVGATVAADVDVGQRRVQTLPHTAKPDASNRGGIVHHRETGDVTLEASDNSAIGW